MSCPHHILVFIVTHEIAVYGICILKITLLFKMLPY